MGSTLNGSTYKFKAVERAYDGLYDAGLNDLANQ